MMRVEINAMLLKPLPDEVTDAGRSRDESSEQQNIARPVDAQSRRREIDPGLDQRVGLADQAFGVRSIGRGVDAADRGSSDDVRGDLSVLEGHEGAGFVGSACAATREDDADSR